MVEEFKGKEVIDIRPKKEDDVSEVSDAEFKEEVKNEDTAQPEPAMPTHMYFTVSSVGKGGRPIHLIIKADNALQALRYVQEVKKVPVMGVHVTEYQDYVDAQEYYESQDKQIIT